MNEKFVNLALRYGGIVVMISVLASVYLVMHSIELTRFNNNADLQLQQMTARRQAMDGLLREFVAKAQTDPFVLEILEKHKLVTLNQSAGQSR